MGPVSDAVVGSFGDTLLVEIGLHSGFEVSTKVANDLILDHTIKHIIPSPSGRVETTGVKTLLVTLKYKHTIEDASLGFFRSSVHPDTSLFSNVKDYLAIEKGWFSPYLFASGRRPIIPRTMKPDFVFCHGPFLEGMLRLWLNYLALTALLGDYAMGQTLLKESASIIMLCDSPLPDSESSTDSSLTDHSHLRLPSLPSLSKYLPQSRSRTPSPEPALTPIPITPQPRRLLVVLVGLKPHRKLWTSSARPGESVFNYTLLNGCPTIVLPAKPGSPLLAWDALTLDQLQNLELPDSQGNGGDKFKGVVNVFCEYLELCVDWDRVKLLSGGSLVEKMVDERADNDGIIADVGIEEKRTAVKNAVSVLLLGAVCSKTSKQVKKEVDPDRAGVVIFRIP